VSRLPEALDRAWLVGQDPDRVDLFCLDCPARRGPDGAEQWWVTVGTLAEALEAWTVHRADVHGAGQRGKARCVVCRHVLAAHKDRAVSPGCAYCTCRVVPTEIAVPSG
jgi:hypothetical protein